MKLSHNCYYFQLITLRPIMTYFEKGFHVWVKVSFSTNVYMFVKITSLYSMWFEDDHLPVETCSCLTWDVYSYTNRSMVIIFQQDATMYSSLYLYKLLYLFRAVTPPIIKSTYNCNYGIWHWSNFEKCSVCIFRSLTSARCCNYSYTSSWWWSSCPKYVEQFTEI
jgi:hypothetical protein